MPMQPEFMTLYDLSKRLEYAESKLQSQKPSVQCATPISTLEGYIPSFNTAEWRATNFAADANENNEFSAWNWDHPMVESLLPGSILFEGNATPIETMNTSATATASTVCSLPQEPGPETISEPMAIEPPSLADHGFGANSPSAEICAELFEAYFNVVQQHLPLLSKEPFFRVLKQLPEKHQTLALKYAVCMAGSRVGNAAFPIKEQYYIAARHHLEHAEMGSNTSSLYTIEAAQALVLVARFEFEHFIDPRGVITMSRLFTLLSILANRKMSASEQGQELDEEKLNQRKLVSLISISMKLQEVSISRSYHSQTPPIPSVHDGIESDHREINLITSSLLIPENGPFKVLYDSLKIAVDAKHHDQMAAAVVASVDLPSFNFCRDHERIETRIGEIVTKFRKSISKGTMYIHPCVKCVWPQGEVAQSCFFDFNSGNMPAASCRNNTPVESASSKGEEGNK